MTLDSVLNFSMIGFFLKLCLLLPPTPWRFKIKMARLSWPWLLPEWAHAPWHTCPCQLPAVVLWCGIRGSWTFTYFSLVIILFCFPHTPQAILFKSNLFIWVRKFPVFFYLSCVWQWILLFCEEFKHIYISIYHVVLHREVHNSKL